MIQQKEVTQGGHKCRHTTHTHTLTHVFALPQNYDAAKEVVVASTDPYYANLIPK